jgi:hypothetical protein
MLTDYADSIERAQPTDSGRVATALRGLLEIGKRDLTNPKYDGFWNEARAALAAQPTDNGNMGLLIKIEDYFYELPNEAD